MADLVLVVAATSSEAQSIVDSLAGHGLEAQPALARDIVRAIEANDGGTAIVTDEALVDEDFQNIVRALSAQPFWADFPLILIELRDAPAATAGERDFPGNVTMLSAPLSIPTLASVARAALRTRRRQLDAGRSHAELTAAEHRIRALETSLMAQAADCAEQLNRMSLDHEAALARIVESEERYRYTIELNALIPWTADPRGGSETVGERWHAITGMDAAEAKGDGWIDALHPDDREEVRAQWHELAASGGDLDIDYRIRMTDGSYRWHRSRAAPRLDADGNIIRYYGTLADIDDRRQAADRLQNVQSELIHISRLSAMDTMASTLAHELNQPLTAITNYLRGCMKMMSRVEGEDVPRIVEALAEADSSALRAGEIMRHLREMVAYGNVEKTSEDLPLLIAQACKIALMDAPMLDIAHRLDFAPGANVVVADRVQVQQVLINLLRNAIEALRNMADAHIVISTHVLSDTYCEVIVRDNGPGLAPEIRERLFSTFNSTKKDGMGVGLSISRTIIESHGGDIWAEAVPGGGTSFHFTLPRG